METRRFQLVELVVNTQQAQGQFFFQNQPLLQSVTGGQRVYIRCIETYSTNALTKSPITSGNNVASPADIKNAVLVISVVGTLELKYIPLSDLNRTWADTAAYTPFVIQPFCFKDLWGMDWTLSYVITVAAAASVPISYLFGVHYEYSTDGQDA